MSSSVSTFTFSDIQILHLLKKKLSTKADEKELGIFARANVSSFDHSHAFLMSVVSYYKEVRARDSA